jgi:hypothetical protein
MGSIAMDTSGNIALGYSVSSSIMYPSVRYTGRMKYDPPGQMTIAEKTVIDGSGSQTGIWDGRGRWGDYSAMSIDPVNPQTFWYTQEYYTSTSQMAWQTRIAAFSFSGILNIHATSSVSAVCTGGSVQLDVEVYGVSGNLSYSWTSIPPGFTSDLKDPIVSPVINTEYIVLVANGSETKTDTLRIFVIPSSSLNAGRDTSYCRNVDKILMQGRAVNYITTKWLTSGDGTFDNPYSLKTFYTPGINDRSADYVDLKLIAYPQPPCNSLSDIQHIVLLPCK